MIINTTHVIRLDFILIVIQIFTERTNLTYLKVVLDSYQQLLSKDEFIQFLLYENDEKQTVFECAVDLSINYEMYTSLTELLFNYVKDDLKIFYKLLNKRTNNIFHIAAKANKFYPLIFYYERIKHLFPSSNPLDIANHLGFTPLHYACHYSHKHFADILLDLGCQVNVKDKHDETPLHYAVASGNFSLVKKLLLHGADRNSLNDKQQKPIDSAYKFKYTSIINLLNDNCYQMITCKTIESLKNQERDSYLIFCYLTVILIKTYLCCVLFNTENIKLFYLIISSMFFDVSIIVIILLFRKYAYSSYREKSKEVKYATELIQGEKNEDNVDHLCVVCKIIKTKDMQHCLVCKRCVSGFDHHCFWLNRCINSNNRKYFAVFILFLLISLTALISIIVEVLCKDILVSQFLIEDEKIRKILKVTLCVVGGMIILYLLTGVFGLIVQIIYITRNCISDIAESKKKEEKEEQLVELKNNI